METAGQIIKRYYDKDNAQLTTLIDTPQLNIANVGDSFTPYGQIIQSLNTQKQQLTLIKSTNNNNDTDNNDITHLIHKDTKLEQPTRYYLETVYYQTPQHFKVPLAVILNLDSNTLTQDQSQQIWLKQLFYDHDFVYQFPQRLLVQHHAVFLSPDMDINPSSPQTNYQHQLGDIISQCGLQLEDWLVLAANNTKAITNHSSHNRLPKLQIITGGGYEPQYKTLIPDLVEIPTGHGWSHVALTPEHITIQYYNCTDLYEQAHLTHPQFSLTYNAEGKRIDQYGQALHDLPRINASLLANTQHYELICVLLFQFLNNAEQSDWRFLAWGIITTLAFDDTLNRYPMSIQLFQGLLTTVDRTDKQLTLKLLDDILKGIWDFFEAYISSQGYIGDYTSFFSQLALWYQILNHIKYKLIQHQTPPKTTSSSLNSPFTINYSLLHQQLTQWLSEAGYTQDTENTYYNYNHHLTFVKPHLIANEFNSPAKHNTDHSELDRLINNHNLTTCLDRLINNRSDLSHYLIKACENALEQRFGNNWTQYMVFMELTNELAQALILTALLYQDVTQALSALFNSQPDNWLSFQLQATLIYLYKNDPIDPDRPSIFTPELADYLPSQKPNDICGQFFVYLAQNKPTTWDYFLTPQACYLLVRQPFIREQIKDWLKWDRERWHEKLTRLYIQHLYTLQDNYHTWLDYIKDYCLYTQQYTHNDVYHFFFDKLDKAIKDQFFSYNKSSQSQEVQTKQLLNKLKPRHNKPDWYQPLQHYCEWFFTQYAPGDRHHKWQLHKHEWLYNRQHPKDHNTQASINMTPQA